MLAGAGMQPPANDALWLLHIGYVAQVGVWSSVEAESLGLANRGRDAAPHIFHREVCGSAQVADWPSAEALLGALAGAGMQPAAVPEVARALCAAVSQRLAPRRAALYPDGPRGRCLLDRFSQGQKRVGPWA